MNELEAFFYVKGRQLLQDLQHNGFQFIVSVKAYAANTQNIGIKEIGQQGKKDS